MRKELELKHKREIKTHDELIDHELLNTKASEGSLMLHSGEHTVSIINGWKLHSPEGRANHLKLPVLPRFSGDDRDDVHSLER